MAYGAGDEVHVGSEIDDHGVEEDFDVSVGVHPRRELTEVNSFGRLSGLIENGEEPSRVLCGQDKPVEDAP